MTGMFWNQIPNTLLEPLAVSLLRNQAIKEGLLLFIQEMGRHVHQDLKADVHNTSNHESYSGIVKVCVPHMY